MKIAIVGSREFKDERFFFNKLHQLLDAYHVDDTTIVSGGARGIDSLAEKFAKQNGCKTKIYPAEWEKYGKKAGYLRNKQIVDEAEKVIAFWDGHSKGTKHSIDLAISKGLPVDIYIRN